MEIAGGIHWTGFIDWDLRSFHGYSTPAGSTYNSFLILDEKPTLIDTVKEYGYDEMLRRVSRIIAPEKIRYIISNHTEMDHSGSLPRILELCPQAEVVCSPQGAEELKRHFKRDWKMKVVNSGDVLEIGKRKFRFVLMPMVHWPDSMSTYCEPDGILFSNDAFGQHFASQERFADEIGTEVIIKEATKYYANIVLPYGGQVEKVLTAVKDLELSQICPSHGLIWRKSEDRRKILGLYKKWAAYESESRAAIIYDTMWHSTEKIANRLAWLLEEAGVITDKINLQHTHISDVMTAVMRSRAVIVGSPILNNNVLPSVGALLVYLRGLKPRNRFGFCFGSYGWSKIGFRWLEDSLREAGMDLPEEGAYFRFVPDAEEMGRLKRISDSVGKLVIK